VNPGRLRELLAEVAAGRCSAEDALERLRHFPSEHLDFATLDHHRALRQGQPEVVYGGGKTVEQVADICTRLVAAHGSFFVTRVTEAQASAVRKRVPGVRWNPLARTLSFAAEGGAPEGPLVLVISAGTSDLPVAEEALEAARAFGLRTEPLVDVGVAGLHRLLAASERLHEAAVIIVVAGMEGALPSVVGGLVARPVIAVPTSVGYGASFHGLAALLGMLNSCAAGVTVVNIDNGFGAAMAANRILMGAERSGVS
jgi:NCAIR mutase (PurE)-related protein